MPPDPVTPRAPDPPLVDPETGETPPLSPSVTQAHDRARIITMQQFLDAGTLGRFPEWQQYERELAAHLEPDDAA